MARLSAQKIRDFLARNPTRRMPVFELLVLVLLAGIGAVAFWLYEVQPTAEGQVESVERLQKECRTIRDFLSTTAQKNQSGLSNFLAHPTDAQGRVIRGQLQESDKWLEDRLALAVEAADETPTQKLATATSSTDIALSVPTAQKALVRILTDARSTLKDYAADADYLLKNAGTTFLIQDRLDKSTRDARQQNLQLIELSRQANRRGRSIEQIFQGHAGLFSSLRVELRQLRFIVLLLSVAVCFSLITLLYRWRLSQATGILLAHANQKVHLDKLSHFSLLAQEVAHEIKQPLTAINARLYTLQKTLAPDSAPAKDAAVIRGEIKRLDQVVKDFLLLAKPSEPILANLSASQALQEVRDLMSAQLEQQSIAFQFDCDQELRLVADLDQLKQVLINLLKNAAESLGNTGNIILRARKDKLPLKDHSPPEDVAVIEVEDNGPGIPPELQTRIFDPFFSTKKDGTGLGLAIAARMIDKQAGRLNFISAPGEGTVFQILLPTRPKPAAL
jgi:signal transduction histidine kinase